MSRLSTSTRLYIGIVLFLVLLTVIGSLLSHLQFLSLAGIQFSIDELLVSHLLLPIAVTLVNTAITAGLGVVGLVLSPKVRFARLWDESVTNRHRFMIPALIGIGIGGVLIIVDLVASQFSDFEHLHTSQFLTSILSALNSGITYEIIFRLFLVTFLVWLVSRVLLKDRWPNQVFWIIIALSACAFIFTSVVPLITVHQITERELPLAYIIERILSAGLVSMFAGYYLRKAGFLAAAGIHVWTNIVWQVVWESLIIAA